MRLMLPFEDRFTRHFPADTDTGRQPRALHKALYARIAPEPLANPRLLLWSPETAAMLGLPAQYETDADTLAIVSGNGVAEGSKPYATVYGGHQFGHWAGQLGDGRAINLGEIGAFTLQLKGAGRTPFSRHADGRAVLRSSIREFLCSEAMHHLGIPSTRALSLVVSDTTVERDMFYNGNPQDEACAVVCRVSESFLRFGHFELPAAREDFELLKKLTDFAIRQHFPNIDADAPDAVAQLFDTVCQRTALLIAQWMSVGFVHGVMNTDNMSVLSETIDYGPYGWLENYDLQWTPNTTDAEGRRYCYGNQPAIAQWNLARLGNALFPLIQDIEPLQAALNAYNQHFHAEWNRLLAAKLGLREPVLAGNPECYRKLVHVLSALEMDFNLFFDALTRIAARDADCTSTESVQAMLACSYLQAPDSASLGDWLAMLENLRALSDLPDRAVVMRAVNPVFILRNHLVQDVIDAAEAGDYAPLQDIFNRLKTPYVDSPDDARWVRKCPPESMQRAGCSMLSCSS
jgi:serine/tyrosine/threonine adenylyltransferase